MFFLLRLSLATQVRIRVCEVLIHLKPVWQFGNTQSQSYEYLRKRIRSELSDEHTLSRVDNILILKQIVSRKFHVTTTSYN